MRSPCLDLGHNDHCVARMQLPVDVDVRLLGGKLLHVVKIAPAPFNDRSRLGGAGHVRCEGTSVPTATAEAALFSSGARS